MKKGFIIFVILFGIFSFMFATENKVGKISQIKGEVIITREGESFVCELGDTLFSDDTVETKKDSSISIALTNEMGECTIKADSKITLSTYLLEDNLNFSLSLSFGEIQTSLTEKEAEDYYNITTPTLTTGVRGTKFIVYSNVLGESFVEVTDGVVEVGEINLDNIDNEDAIAIKNAIRVQKGERIRNILSQNNKIISASQSLDELKQHAIESGNVESVIPFYITKLKMLSKGIYKIKNIHQKLTKIDKKVMDIFNKARDKVNKAKHKYGDLFSDEDYNRIMKKINRKNKKVHDKLIRHKRKLMKYGFLLLNNYYATIDVLKELLNYIKDNDIKLSGDEFINLKREFAKFKKTNEKVEQLKVDWNKYIHSQNMKMRKTN